MVFLKYKVKDYNATGFYEAGKTFNLSSTSPVAFLRKYYSVSAVNLSLACELFLKYIIYKENHQTNEGHNLFDLYKKLKEETKNKIKLSYDNKNCLLSFYDSLTIHQNIFIDFRYNYEITDTSKTSGLQLSIASLENLTTVLYNYSKDMLEKQRD